YEVGLAVDEQYHVFVSSAEFDPVAHRVVGLKVQRFEETGTPDPTWPQSGALLTETFPVDLTLFPDGVGGVFAGWDVPLVCVEICPPPPRWAARVLGNGQPDDRWTPGRPGISNAPDGMGGMLLGRVVHGRPGAVRLDAAGAVMPGWQPEGNAAMTEVVDPWQVWVVSDAEGGAYVAWSDHRSGGPRLHASRRDAEGRAAARWPATGTAVTYR